MPPPDKPGERYCEQCKPTLTIVYAAFEYSQGWKVIFYDSTTQKRLPRTLLLQDNEKLFELARRGQCLQNLADKQAVEAAIHCGRDGLFLKLTREQYAKLQR